MRIYTGQQLSEELSGNPSLLSLLNDGARVRLQPSTRSWIIGLPDQQKIKVLIAGHEFYYPLNHRGLACALDLIKRL